MTLFPLNQRQRRPVAPLRMMRPHVVRVGQTKVLVEPMLQWQEFFVVAQIATCQRALSRSRVLCRFADQLLARGDARLGLWSRCTWMPMRFG